MSGQDPIVLAESVPEPDLTLLRPRDDFYTNEDTRPDHDLLLIEVADTSLVFNRDVKDPLDAEEDIPEYGIIDWNQTLLRVHCRPRVDGTFKEVFSMRPGESIKLLAISDMSRTVSDLFGVGQPTRKAPSLDSAWINGPRPWTAPPRGGPGLRVRPVLLPWRT